MTTAKDVMKMIKDNDVKFVDFRFTDPRGKWQHVTVDISTIEEDTFSEGIMFDGSSIAGWKAIHESDMNLMPDPESACIDPFFAETTLVLVCDTLEPLTGEPYNRDPRSIARKAEGLVKAWGIRSEDTFSEGIMCDGSSIAGWKAIHESDMNLMPDPESACIDPFFAETTLVLVCDTLEPLTGEPYNRDPRSIARKAEGLVKAWGI